MSFKSGPNVTSSGRSRRCQRTRALTVWVSIFGLSLAALIATYMFFVEPPPPRKIVIATGAQNGAYFRYAQRYAEDLHKHGLSVEVRETSRYRPSDESIMPAISNLKSKMTNLDKLNNFGATAASPWRTLMNRKRTLIRRMRPLLIWGSLFVMSIIHL